MTRTWFSHDLETVATFWRVQRRDGVTLGFTSHDSDLWFDGVVHRSAPGMIPSSIRRTADFEPDSAEVQGALSHESISAADLSAGRFDGAQVRIGLVDWETLEREVLYRGAIGGVVEEDGRFTAELVSRKAELQRDPIPRTSPACRAEFCGPGCGLPSVLYTHEVSVTTTNIANNRVTLNLPKLAERFVGGALRWIDGPHAGVAMQVLATFGSALVLDTPISAALSSGHRGILREGCDHTIFTCAQRFGNASNFQGEPYLPGNDHITRYPTPG